MITLEQAKAHLRVVHSEEDAVIESMVNASTAAALDYLNLEAMPEPAPAPVEAAILLQVGDLYENRQRQSDRPFHGNQTYERLLNPYRVMDV